MKTYSDGSKGNKIGDEIIWLLVKIVIRDQFGRTYNFQRLKEEMLMEFLNDDI